MKQPNSRTPRRTQRGAVVVVLGVILALLVGFIGLAIDLGRFFVIKSELQNAMDACALSAASQLKPGANDPNALVRAIAYGKVFATGGTGNIDAIKNKVNFQSLALDPNVLEITFGVNNNDNPFAATFNTAHYVKCNYPLNNLPVLFMRVLTGSGAETVSAFAVAKREAPLASCLPVAVCASTTGTPANNWGLTKGQWLTAIDGTSYGTGNFGWAGLTAPGSAAQLKDALTGTVQCDVGDPSQMVYGQGLMAGLTKEWNTRFGLYAPSMSADTAPPDHTGFSYSNAVAAAPLPAGNWPAGADAYAGSALVPNFQAASGSNLTYDKSSPQPPDFPVNQYMGLTPEQQVALGKVNRRIVTAPIVDCSIWNTTPPATKNLPVKDWACVLMLNPYDESGPATAPRRSAKLEFLDLSTAASSPCSGGAVLAIAPVLTQ